MPIAALIFKAIELSNKDITQFVIIFPPQNRMNILYHLIFLNTAMLISTVKKNIIKTSRIEFVKIMTLLVTV